MELTTLIMDFVFSLITEVVLPGSTELELKDVEY